MIINIGNENVTCDYTGQEIHDVLSFTKYSTVYISLICPNIAQYCRMPRPCPNYCSSNGYCRNSVCNCLPGW